MFAYWNKTSENYTTVLVTLSEVCDKAYPLLHHW